MRDFGPKSLLLASAFAGVFTTACPSDPEPEEFNPWTLEDLTSAQGLSLRLPEFEVAAGTELQDCYFIRMPDLNNGQPMWINRFHTAINPGSHHLNIFRVKTIKGLDPAAGEDIDIGGGMTAKVVRGGMAPMGECWKSGNWADWPLVANSQNSNESNPYTDWTLPAGVASKFEPGELLMVQTHYVNASTQKAPYKGRVGVNFHKFTGAAEPIELGTLFATQQSIRICRSNPTPTFSGTCSFPETATVTITAMNGHFHSRGKTFDVYSWDGVSTTTPPESDMIYSSNTWDDPPMDKDMAVSAPKGGGVYWSCTYQWAEPAAGCGPVDARDPSMNKDCCYTFGPVVETSEHCNVFVYYYPKVERTDISCN